MKALENGIQQSDKKYNKTVIPFASLRVPVNAT